MASRRESERVARTGALTGVLLLLTMIAHAGANGSMPSVIAIVVAAAPAFALALVAGARRRSAARLAGILLVGELLLHMVLAGASGHAHSLLPSPAMLIAHVLAAAAAALVFAHGERIAGRWAAYLGQALGAPTLRLPTPVALHLPSFIAPDDDLRVHRLAHHVVRRGPPALAA